MVVIKPCFSCLLSWLLSCFDIGTKFKNPLFCDCAVHTQEKATKGECFFRSVTLIVLRIWTGKNLASTSSFRLLFSFVLLWKSSHTSVLSLHHSICLLCSPKNQLNSSSAVNWTICPDFSYTWKNVPLYSQGMEETWKSSPVTSGDTYLVWFSIRRIFIPIFIFWP